MIHEETVNVFTQEYKKICRVAHSALSGNGSDVMWYPHIPDGVKRGVRNNFDLNIDEEILFVRDTSFWNNRDQGLVITDCRIVIILDNDSPKDILQLPWDEVKNVEYDANCLNFFGLGGRDDVAPIPMELFTKNIGYDNMKLCGRKLAELFTSLAETQKSLSPSDASDTFYNLIDEGKEDEALEFALGFRDEDEYNIQLSDDIAELYEKRGQVELGLRVLNEDVDKLENDAEDLDSEKVKYWLFVLRGTRAEMYGRLGNTAFSRADFVYVMNNMPDEDVTPEAYNKIEDEFKESETNFMEHFLEIPYQKRKTLVAVKSYEGIDVNQTALQVISMDYLPDIKFPVGHPIVNQLYVGHPYLPHKYIPFENYEQEFIEDKIREYCQIMQFLGATEINIESVNSSDSIESVNSSDSKSAENVNVKWEGQANIRSVSASGKSTSDTANRLLESISQSIQLHQIYHPKKAPKLPTDMVWYDNEPSWQRTYEQRMHGSLLEHEERIETKKSRVVNSSELKTLSAEFKLVILNAGGKWEQSIEEQFETQENVILSIKVKFAPLESLQGGGESNMGKNEESVTEKAHDKEEYTAVEKEYMEEVRACLEESSEISSGERRLLDRLRGKLGISAERAAELEATLQQPQLTDEEEEYMEEFKACLEESSEISSGERRLLNRVRDKLGISEERAAEIEGMCKTTK